jgi:hypothetical protein
MGIEMGDDSQDQYNVGYNTECVGLIFYLQRSDIKRNQAKFDAGSERFRTRDALHRRNELSTQISRLE